MTKQEFEKFQDFAFKVKHNRDTYSRAKIIEMLVSKAGEFTYDEFSASEGEAVTNKSEVKEICSNCEFELTNKEIYDGVCGCGTPCIAN